MPIKQVLTDKRVTPPPLSRLSFYFAMRLSAPKTLSKS